MDTVSVPGIGIWVGAFACGFLLDVLWAICVACVARSRAALAAHLAVAIYLCTIFSTVLIVERQVVACVAYAAGCWLGTFTAVKWFK